MKQEGNLRRKCILKVFKGNPKKFYGYMRHMQSVEDNVTALKKENGELTETDQETVDLLYRSLHSGRHHQHTYS